MDEFQRGKEAGYDAGSAGSGYAPESSSEAFVAGYSAGYSQGRETWEAEKRLKERQAQEEEARKRAPLRSELAQLGRVLYGANWEQVKADYAELDSAGLQRLIRQFTYEPEAFVPKKRLPAVEEALYGDEVGGVYRRLLIASLNALIDAVVIEKYVDDFVRAATGRLTGYPRPDWTRCTTVDLQTIFANVRIDPGTYCERAWIESGYRRRAPIYYGM